MATKKQITANRKNARKSTGPRSEGRRAISAMNAVMHGMNLKSEIALYECSDAYAENFQALVEEFRPIGPTEFRTVRQMARCNWDQDRLANRYKYELFKGHRRRFLAMYGHKLEGATEEEQEEMFSEFQKQPMDVDINVDIMTKLHNNDIKLDRRFESLLERLFMLQARTMEARSSGAESNNSASVGSRLAEFAEKEEEARWAQNSLREEIQEAMRRRQTDGNAT